MKLAAYCRVSTAAQVEMFGLDVQAARINQWADAENHHIVKWYVDEGVTGTTLKRVGLQEAMASVASGEVKGIVAADQDRYARRLDLQEAIFATCWLSGAKVFTVRGEILEDDPEDPTRTLIRQVMGAVAQWEAVNIRARMARGKRAKVAAGGYGGGYLPYGKMVQDGRLVPCPGEAGVVEVILSLSRNGCSQASIASQLNADGIKNRGGGPWNIYSVRRVLKNAGVLR